VSNFGFVIAVV